MQKFVQKYVFVTFLEDIHEGAEFPSSSWPLHITIASNFIVVCSVPELLEKLKVKVNQRSPIKVTAGNDEFFGPQKQRRVTVLNMNDGLKLLHRDFITLLKNVGAVFNEPAYIVAGFRAHATVQRDMRVQEGDTVITDQISLIDMFPDNDASRCKVLKIIELLGTGCAGLSP